MIRCRRLTHFDVDNFVDDVLVKETEWLPRAGEALTGSYVFVCAHGSRDRRCGVCGPVLIEKFKEEISSQGLQDKVSVSPCSHIGGHKYAGNVIIFSQTPMGKLLVMGMDMLHQMMYLYCLNKHIGKGEIVDHLCRGCRNFQNLHFSQVVLLFTIFFTVKSCLRKESLCPLRGDEVDAIMLPALLVTTGATASGCGADIILAFERKIFPSMRKSWNSKLLKQIRRSYRKMLSKQWRPSLKGFYGYSCRIKNLGKVIHYSTNTISFCQSIRIGFSISSNI